MTMNGVGPRFADEVPNRFAATTNAAGKPVASEQVAPQSKPAAKPDAVESDLAKAKEQGTKKTAEQEALIQEMFQKADKNADGKVDLSEFNQMVQDFASKEGIPLPDEKTTSKNLKASFDTIDANGDGKLSKDEFKVLVTKQLKLEQIAKPQQESASAMTVTVKAGDTLAKVARENGLSLDELRAANPDLFQKGKDSTGKLRTVGGDLIYPGDAIKIPGMAKPAAEEKPAVETKPATEQKPDTEVKPATEQDPAATADGTEKAPEEPVKSVLSEQAKNGRALLDEAAKDPSFVGKWTVQEKADVLAFARDTAIVGMDEAFDENTPPAEAAKAVQGIAKAIDEVKKFAQKHGMFDLEGDVRDIEKQIKPDELMKRAVDGVQADLEARLAAKTGKKDFKIAFLDDMSDADKLKQFALIDSLLSDPSYDATWKKFDSIGVDVYESRRDGAADNLKGYVEVKGGMLKLNNPGNGWGGDDGLKDVEVDKQRRAMRHLRDTGEQP